MKAVAVGVRRYPVRTTACCALWPCQAFAYSGMEWAPSSTADCRLHTNTASLACTPTPRIHNERTCTQSHHHHTVPQHPAHGGYLMEPSYHSTGNVRTGDVHVRNSVPERLTPPAPLPTSGLPHNTPGPSSPIPASTAVHAADSTGLSCCAVVLCFPANPTCSLRVPGP